MEEVLTRYIKFIKKDYDKYVEPQMKYADLIVPGGAHNVLAKNILAQYWLTHLEKQKLPFQQSDF